MASKIRKLLLLAFFILLPSLALAAPMQAGAAPGARSGFMPAAAEIGQQIQELVTGDPNAEIEPQETFGTRALSVLLNSFKLLGSESADFVTNFAALPQLSTWFNQQISDPLTADRWTQTGKVLIIVIGGAFAAGWLVDLILLPLRRKLYRRHYANGFAKAGGIVGWLLLSLIPVMAFIFTALGLLDQSDPIKLIRFIVMTVVYALALLRLVRVGVRFLLSPRAQNLRLIPVSSEQAAHIVDWVSWFAAVIIFGYFTTDIAKLVKVPSAVLSGFRSLIALMIVSMTIGLILQKRAAVSAVLRGELSAFHARQSLFDNLRLWLARTWHVLAISYLVIGYFVTMLGPVGGFQTMQQGTIGTVVVLFAMRFAFFMAAKIDYKREEDAPAPGLYRPVLRLMTKAAIWVLGAAGVAASWGVDVTALVMSPWGQRVSGSAVSIAATVLALVFFYEIINRAIERKLNRYDPQGHLIEASPRAKTLLPMVRYAAILVLCLIGGLVTLSELGINTGPLLAGAGVLGVAVGFGSQTLVKDFLTGLFIILEDTISVGDIVKIGDDSGVVEGMTIRTARLRDFDGSLHTLPFSEITRITNMSKGFSYAVIELGVAYDSDLNKVMRLMGEVGEAMAREPAFTPLILAPMEIQGVETLGDSSIVVRGRIKTMGGKQWDVRRGYLLRVKERFDKENIEIPFPQRVLHHIYEKPAPQEG